MKKVCDNRNQLSRRLAQAYRRVAETGKVHPGPASAGDVQEEKSRAAEDRNSPEILQQVVSILAAYFSSVLALKKGRRQDRDEIKRRDVLKPYVMQVLTSSEKASALTRSLLAFNRKKSVRDLSRPALALSGNEHCS